MLRFRESPWDAAVLGGKTHELLAFDTPEEVDDYEDACRQFGVGFTACRVGGTEYDKHLALQQNGYAQVSTILHVRLEAAAVPLHAPLPNGMALLPACPEDAPALRQIVSTYRFGPFHDDPLISVAAASQRMQNRIAPLMREMPLLVAEDESGVHGFMAMRAVDDVWELVLGGVAPGPLRGRVFWAAVLRHLADRGATAIWAPISVTNLPVMNLYAKLGFKFTECFVQFHKHRV